MTNKADELPFGHAQVEILYDDRSTLGGVITLPELGHLQKGRNGLSLGYRKLAGSDLTAGGAGDRCSLSEIYLDVVFVDPQAAGGNAAQSVWADALTCRQIEPRPIGWTLNHTADELTAGKRSTVACAAVLDGVESPANVKNGEIGALDLSEPGASLFYVRQAGDFYERFHFLFS
jgi:hypothetical protein